MRAITDPQRVSVLADPPVPGAPTGQWWPPVALTSAWLDAHAGEVDVLHVHFGLESFSADELRSALDTARRHGIPVVYTVHDLDNPQLTDQAPYRALLDVIIPTADRLLTLTAGTADEVQRRWGANADVLPHPTLLDAPPSPAPRSRENGPMRVGVHLRDLRPNIAAEGIVRDAVVASALWESTGSPAVIEILLNDRVRDEAAATRIETAASGHPHVQVRRTAYLPDAAVEDWISGLDLFVLPYHHGTHSGWIELCYDLGVRVAATDVGHLREQHPGDFSALALGEPQTMVEAMRVAAAARASVDDRVALRERRRAERVAERQSVRTAHADLYALLRDGVLA